MADLDGSKAEAYAGKHGGRPYTDLSAMIAAESPDLLAVCTPSGMHTEAVIAASRSGVRNIVVEKPMALRLPDADAMIAACEENRTRLFVVKQNRYNLPIKKLREALDQGRFGKLVLGAVRVRWCRRQIITTRLPGAGRGPWTAASSPTRPPITWTCSST